VASAPPAGEAPAAPPPPQAAAVEVSVASIATPPERTRDAVADDLASLLGWWPAVVDLVRDGNAMLGACIQDARPVEVTGEDLTVAFGAPFLKKKAEKPDNRAVVTAALHDVTGRRWRLSYELHDGIGAAGGDEATPLSEQEWVQRFIDEFDAEELVDEGDPAGGGEPGEGRQPNGGAPVTSDQKGA
jgi:hypothetical protein